MSIEVALYDLFLHGSFDILGIDLLIKSILFFLVIKPLPLVHRSYNFRLLGKSKRDEEGGELKDLVCNELVV